MAEEGNDIVALINMKGVIADSSGGRGPGPFGKPGGLNFTNVRFLVENAFSLERVLCVVLIINSPGGSPTQTNLIASYVRDKAEESRTPVLALIEDIAASGGYWLACAADEIYVDSSSMVGSIGVIFQNVGVGGTMEKLGVEPRVIQSAQNKAGLHPLLQYDETQEKIVRENMAVIHGNFVSWVKSRRPKLREEQSAENFSGRVFVGAEAVERGLADGVATLSEVLKAKYPGRTDLKLVEVKRRLEGGLLGLMGHLFQRSSKVLKQVTGFLNTVKQSAPPEK